MGSKADGELKEASKMLKTYLLIAQVVLAISATIDLALYLRHNYHVPSWVISAVSIGAILLIEALKRLLN